MHCEAPAPLAMPVPQCLAGLPRHRRWCVQRCGAMRGNPVERDARITECRASSHGAAMPRLRRKARRRAEADTYYGACPPFLLGARPKVFSSAWPGHTKPPRVHGTTPARSSISRRFAGQRDMSQVLPPTAPWSSIAEKNWSFSATVCFCGSLLESKATLYGTRDRLLGFAKRSCGMGQAVKAAPFAKMRWNRP